MTLSVLSVAYPLAGIGANDSGGAEQILAMLDRALVRAGHRSIVIAAYNSRVRGELVPLPCPREPYDGEVIIRAHEACRAAIQDVIATVAIDIVHMHGVDFFHYLPSPGVPVLATLHLPLDWYPPRALSPDRPATWLNCVSTAQHRTRPHSAHFLAPIPNGIPLGSGLTVRKGVYALILGRICPEKGVHIALDAAARAKIPVTLAGKVCPYPAHLDYFERMVKPRLGPTSRYVGVISGKTKRRILSGARCLIVASLAEETSSLVTMEALAAGTPVVAFEKGALAEAIDHRRTGYLVADEEEMVEAIRSVDLIDPQACRLTARQRFDVNIMLDRYLALYARLAGKAADCPGAAA